MIRPIWFMGTAALILGLLAYIYATPPRLDPFSDPRIVEPFHADRVLGHSWFDLKLRHALAESPYDIGVFGDSRSLTIKADDIGRAPCTFFNFSVTSQSIRANAVLMNELARADRLPRLSIVSVDNFALQYFGGVQYPAGLRAAAFLKDLFGGLRDPRVSAGDLARVAWRWLFDSWIDLKNRLTVRDILSSAEMILSGTEPDIFNAKVGRGDYWRDGARTERTASLHDPVVKPSPAQILDGYFIRDLEAIKRLETSKHQIVLYESPVESHGLGEPSAIELHSRELFVTTCRRLKLPCYTELGPISKSPTLLWQDASHPPGRLLGALLSPILPPADQVCHA